LSFATSLPLLTNLALLLGLSLFFGLAFEEFQAHQGRTQPGGVRTFPLLALAGAMLYLLERGPTRQSLVRGGAGW